MKYSLGISNFLEEISSLSHSIVFLYFFVLITEEGFLISPCYSCYTREDSTYGHHRNQTDYILCSQRWRSSIQSAKTRPGVDGGSDHELLIVKFRLKLKEVGKTTGPFRYDLNQIAYDYTVQVTNSFKGLDLLDSAWRTMDRGSWHCTEGRNKAHPQEEEKQKGKWLSEEVL